MATLTRVTKDRLARDLAARQKLAEEDAVQILRALCDCIREHLRAGSSVELGDLLSIIVSGGPEIREDESGGFSAYATKGRILAAKPLGTLRNDLEKARAAAIYYLARGNEQFHALLLDHFGRRGWRVVHAAQTVELQSKLESDPPAALLVESHVEGWRDLVREVKCNPRTNGVPVVAIFPAGARDEPVATVSVEPDEAIVEPFDVHQFIRTAATALAARVAAPAKDVVELNFSLPGGHHARQRARQLVEEVLFRCRLGETFIADASAALDEALDNAVRHGHRGVECCTIGLRMILDPRRLVLAVRDTGGGFDHVAVLAAVRARRVGKDANTKDHLLRAAQALRTRKGAGDEGGIARALRLVDRVEFNRVGNEIVLTKFREGSVPAR